VLFIALLETGVDIDELSSVKPSEGVRTREKINNSIEKNEKFLKVLMMYDSILQRK
jgi:hypothetical protein